MEFTELAKYIGGMAADSFDAQFRWWFIGFGAGLLACITSFALRMLSWGLRGGTGPIDTSV